MTVNRQMTHYLAVGDTLTPLKAQLYRDGAAVNLTDLTVKFTMYSDAGALVVDAADAAVVDAATGRVEYDFQDADVDAAGIFWGWFQAFDGDEERDTYPPDGRKLQILISAVG